MSHSTDKFRWGPIRCMKISGCENFCASERGEGVSKFSVEIFCLTVPKVSVRANPLVFHLFRVSKKFGQEVRGGSFKIFSQNFFCLTVPKNFVGEHFSVSLISGTQNLYVSEGYVTIFDFQSKFFVSQCPKNSWANPSLLCFRKSPVAKKFKDERWGRVLRFSVETFLSHSAANYRRGGIL